MQVPVHTQNYENCTPQKTAKTLQARAIYTENFLHLIHEYCVKKLLQFISTHIFYRI